MTRNVKVLGLAIVAVLAMSAVVASAAQAGTLKAAEAANLDAKQVAEENHVFTLTDNGNLTTKCTGATFTGTLAAAGSSTPTVHPEYTGCTAFGLKATIVTTGCNYLFHIGSTIGTTGKFDGSVDIECEAGKSITITAGTCEVKVDPQTGLSTVEAGNVAGSNPMTVEIGAAVKKIHYTVIKDGFLCPLTGEGKEFTEGDYTGDTTLTASNAGGTQINVTLED